jgi:acyl-CoA thioester hydrolase
MPLETVSEVRVRYAETDQMGVVYHANYLVWCEIGRTDFIRALGTPYAQLEREGILLAVSDVTMRFHASARYDDPIRILTRLIEVRSRAMTFDYRIEQGETNTILVSARTTLVSMSRDNRLIALPEAVRSLLRTAVTTSDPTTP